MLYGRESAHKGDWQKRRDTWKSLVRRGLQQRKNRIVNWINMLRRLRIVRGSWDHTHWAVEGKGQENTWAAPRGPLLRNWTMKEWTENLGTEIVFFWFMLLQLCKDNRYSKGENHWCRRRWRKWQDSECDKSNGISMSKSRERSEWD